MAEVTEGVFTARELPAHIACQVLSFLRITATEGFVGPNLYRDWITSTPEATEHVIIDCDGILISHTEVKSAMLSHAGRTYRAFGLSGVMTYPAFRRQGFGRRVVRLGTDRMAEQGADIGLFNCAPDLRGFYEAEGWEAMDSTRTLYGDPAQPRVSDELLMMRFFRLSTSEQESFRETDLYVGSETW